MISKENLIQMVNTLNAKYKNVKFKHHAEIYFTKYNDIYLTIDHQIFRRNNCIRKDGSKTGINFTEAYRLLNIYV